MPRLCLLLVAFAMVAQAPRGSISGQILDATTGQPVPGARVSVSQPDAGRTVTADSDGRDQVADVGSGAPGLRVQAAGYLPREYGDAPPLGHTPITIQGRQLTSIDVALHRSCSIAGRVVDETGSRWLPSRFAPSGSAATRHNQLMSFAG